MTENIIKILLLDIETAPNLAYVWGLFEQNVAINQIADVSYVMCWAAKWHGEKEVMFDSVRKSGPKKMLERIHKLLCEADVVVHYNGMKFDIPTLNKEFLIHKMSPPSPYRQVDLLRVSRGTFKFQSHKLDYVSQQLGLGSKLKHTGFQLWIDCMENKRAAWSSMEKYNKQDVILLEKVYEKFRPWIKNHPNHGLYDGVECCPRCAGTNIQARGKARTKAVTYQRYQCKDCGSWFKGDKDITHVKPKFSEVI
ncbi:MAG: hypothetical protein E6R03_00060 [Hyphomicrobiaceae bacterium]|nr:MAG: hypothetical protein E6R03_00060 [Hyphomicrobiaceae bacterium]